ncbi:MAG: 4-hydroxy-3-methylbut-2-enyl diphosphate reductase [Candidatus Aminicenantia bacterium]
MVTKSGFCFGVKRAINIARQIRREKKGKVFTFGDLIHNQQVVENLRKEGIESIDDISQIKGGTIIIRSHGISPHIFQQLVDKGIEVIDATCPFVKKSQKLVKKLADEDYEIIIVGNKPHPEIKGLIGFSQGKEVVIKSEEEVDLLPKKNKRGVIAQSTQDITLYQKIVSKLIEKTRELKVFNTICDSTQIRQKATAQLAAQVDIMLIIGDRKSSNTNKLYNLAKRIQENTYFIEKTDNLTPKMIAFAEEIGVSAGASTPHELIMEVVERIKEIKKSKSNQQIEENLIQWMN